MCDTHDLSVYQKMIAYAWLNLNYTNVIEYMWPRSLLGVMVGDRARVLAAM